MRSKKRELSREKETQKCVLIIQDTDNKETLCVECGSKLINIEGCLKCMNCGWTPCE